jgi:hypothetical protein
LNFKAQAKVARLPILPMGRPRRESKHPMNKRQLIEEIRQLNQTAQPEFLAQFDDDALHQYLRHLENAQQKRLKVEGWVKSLPRPKFRLVS